MGALAEDIKTQSDWVVKALKSDNLILDYTIHSFINVDKFFVQNTKNGMPVKRLSKNHGVIIFSLGSYVGETLIKEIPGSFWHVDEDDPEGELNISVKLSDGTIVWPVQRVIKRFQNGAEDSVYVYGHHLINQFEKISFDESYWTIENESATNTKPWWKFW